MPKFAFETPPPPSWNLSYRIVKPRSSPRHTLAKTSDAWEWQTIASAIVQRAKPDDFAPVGQIVVRYRFFLRRRMDADNMMKLLNDAIAYGLGTKMGKTKPVPIYDDALFLPCVESLATGDANPRVEVTIEW